MKRQDDFQIILKKKTSISQKSCGHIFSMCFVAFRNYMGGIHLNLNTHMHKNFSLILRMPWVLSGCGPFKLGLIWRNWHLSLLRFSPASLVWLNLAH